jgi:hypothetical protein
MIAGAIDVPSFGALASIVRLNSPAYSAIFAAAAPTYRPDIKRAGNQANGQAQFLELSAAAAITGWLLA